MAIKFNPLTGTFDFTGAGGGGGGASYIDGEVATYADLPLDGSATLNSAWLVRTASGVWPVTRKQAGIYIRTATGGSNRDSDYTYAGTMPDVFSDSQFLLYDNTDTSKNLAFDLGSITTGTARTLTAPNASGRIQVEGQPIGNTTPAAGTFTTLTATDSSLTFGAGTASSPTVKFAGSNVGIYQRASAELTLTDGNEPQARYFSNAIVVNSDFSIQWGNSTTAPTGGDTMLRRDAAGVLAQYNAANPQEYRIYNTFTSATNHERLRLAWASNVAILGTEKGSGGGTARALEFQTDGSTRMAIGAAGGTTNFGDFTLPQANRLRFSASGTRIAGASDGLLRISNGAENDFDRLQFGGTTTSFPALKRSSTVLQARLANDSDFCPLQGQLRIHQNAVSETITATHTLTLYDAAGTAYKVPCVAA